MFRSPLKSKLIEKHKGLGPKNLCSVAMESWRTAACSSSVLCTWTGLFPSCACCSDSNPHTQVETNVHIFKGGQTQEAWVLTECFLQTVAEAILGRIQASQLHVEWIAHNKHTCTRSHSTSMHIHRGELMTHIHPEMSWQCRTRWMADWGLPPSGRFLKLKPRSLPYVLSCTKHCLSGL